MPHVKGTHHTAIRVKDYARTLDFYTNVLGLVKTVEWGGE